MQIQYILLKFFSLKNLRKHKREHLICHSCIFDSILIKKEELADFTAEARKTPEEHRVSYGPKQ